MGKQHSKPSSRTWKRQPDGNFQSRVDVIRNLQKHGYYVVPLFAGLTLVFDNSRDEKHVFTLVRAQRKEELLYDCRATGFEQDSDLLQVADLWLRNVVPL